MTCYAMINGNNPGNVDQDLSQSGFITKNASMPNYEGAAVTLGFTVSDTVINAQPGDVATALQNDDYVIAVLEDSAGDQHYVLVTGATFNPQTGNCDFKIQDPGYPYNYLSAYDSTDYSLSMVMEIN